MKIKQQQGLSLRNSKGFSLIELILVIGIIAILSGGALFSFSKLQKMSSLEKGITDVREKLTAARESVRKGKCKTMSFIFSESQKKFIGQCKDEGKNDLTFLAVVPSDFNWQNIGGVREEEFELINNNLGGLSLNPVNPSSFSSFVLELNKQGEKQTLTLDQSKILYGPF